MNNENITQEGKGCIAAFFKILLMFVLFIFGIFILLAILFKCESSPMVKTKFNDDLISDMENQFGITVMDNIELVRYTYTPAFWLDDNSEDLELKTDDYERFLKYNVNYEVENFKIMDSQIENSFAASFHYNVRRNHEDYNVVGRIYRYSDDEIYHICLSYTW